MSRQRPPHNHELWSYVATNLTRVVKFASVMAPRITTPMGASNNNNGLNVPSNMVSRVLDG